MIATRPALMLSGAASAATMRAAAVTWECVDGIALREHVERSHHVGHKDDPADRICRLARRYQQPDDRYQRKRQNQK
jgi:hypothetical protein